jgi:protein-S-isoprenylcysteine O-methyltransferase Ste14
MSALFTLERLYPTGFLSLALNAIGAGLVVLAKRDLGRCHTWTGYGSARSHLVTCGIYGVIRHPLYAGIYLFAIGSLLLISMHATWYLVLTMVVTLSYILTFLAVAARREDRLLQKQIGAEYLAYQARVPAFFPIRWHRRPNYQ